MARAKKNPHAGKTGHLRDFLKAVFDLAIDGRSGGGVIDDLLELSYCALRKPTLLGAEADAIEARYAERVGRLDADYVREMPRVLGLLTAGVCAGDPGDILGEAIEAVGGFNGDLGQFMTPWHAALMMAEMTISDVETIASTKGFIAVAEPSCGTGGMILAAAEVVRKRGFDPSEMLWVQATDISDLMFKAAYVQLAVAGVPGEVVRGDSLSGKRWESAYTPAALPFVAQHRQAWLDWRRGRAVDAPPPHAEHQQADLFGAIA